MGWERLEEGFYFRSVEGRGKNIIVALVEAPAGAGVLPV